MSLDSDKYWPERFGKTEVNTGPQWTKDGSIPRISEDLLESSIDRFILKEKTYVTFIHGKDSIFYYAFKGNIERN